MPSAPSGIHSVTVSHSGVRTSRRRRALSDTWTGAGPWLNPDQACAYVGLPSRKALYQIVRRGQLPAHRLGSRLRFSRRELDRFLGKR